MIIVKAAIYITLICFSQNAISEIVFNSKCKEAYKEIYNFNFKEAQAFIDLEKKSNPGNFAPIYLENLKECFQLFNTESSTDYQILKHKRKERVLLLEKENIDNPYRNYLIAEIYLHWAAISIKHNDFLKAAKEINFSYQYAEANSKLHPDFEPNLKLMSLLHIGIGSIPNRYQWMANIIGYKGSINDGQRELDAFYSYCINDEEASYLLTEAFIFKIAIAIHINQDRDEVAKILKEAPNIKLMNSSPMYVYIVASAYDFLGENNKILPLIKNKPKLFYLEYLKGLSLLHNLNETSEIWFKKYLQHKTKHFVKSSLQKIAWQKLISGDTASYLEYMAQVKSNGSTLFESDKVAMKEAKDGIIPNVKLLKARLLFDGGYYSKSLAVLNSINQENTMANIDENIELIYRYGRVYDKLGFKSKAVEYYNITIELGEKQSNHYAANSALCVAKLYESSKEYKKATSYYLLCISLKGFSYGSISDKAKKGLERIRKKAAK